LLRAIEGYGGEIATGVALRLAPHVFVRPGELRQAEWTEIDLELAIWRIPAVRMKMRTQHQVPLSKQVVAMLKELQPYSGAGRFVFPSVLTPKRPMCENTLNTALRRMGYTHDEMTSHGFRTTASTLLNESGKWRVDVIERALAHGDSDQVRAAYNRAAMWSERVEMAQWWSDYLDTLRTGADVLPFRRLG
jgi:integrase